MRSFSFLVNPVSGGGKAPAAVIPVAQVLRDAGAKVEVTTSTSRAAGIEIVEAAVARGDVVVAAGGDGMLSSVAGRVSELGGTLGLVPAGRGNDFARMLGLPTMYDQIAATLLEGTGTSVDLIAFTAPGRQKQFVVGSVYSGVDAKAGLLVDRLRCLPSSVQYPYAAIHALATYVPTDFTVVVDGDKRVFRAATVVVANSGYYGKGMHIAPNASVSDGQLDVIVIEAGSRRSMIRSLPKAYSGSHLELDEVTELRGRSVEVSGTPSVPMGGDGEAIGPLPESSTDPARIEVAPGALTVLV